MQANIARQVFLIIWVCCFGPSLVVAEEKTVIEVNRVRLYLPDTELRRRLGDDVKPLANYTKALVQEAGIYWEQFMPPEAKGLLIAVGVKPAKRAKVWCEGVEGEIPTDVLRALEKKLGGVPTIEVRQAPIAFAIEVRFRGQQVENFPVAPKMWTDVAEKSKRSLTIPDDLFKVIWPD